MIKLIIFILLFLFSCKNPITLKDIPKPRDPKCPACPTAPEPVWKNKKVLTFDGINEYLDTNVNRNFSGETNFSVFIWVKDIPPGDNYIVVQTNTSSPYRSDWILGYPNGGLWFDGSTVNGNDIISDGKWHLIGFTFDGQDAELYIDGNYMGYCTPSIIGGIDSIKLMSRGSGKADFVSGKIDEASIWKRKLSQTQIDQIYNSGVPGDLSKLKFYSKVTNWWRMGDEDVFPAISDLKKNRSAVMMNMEPEDIINKPK